ncbi:MULTISPECIES: GldG family protein [unclassified Coleofasciculus]|uniref:GldG family protein n=1 Tax=unclassified Coleofasciculus TaxID=2692782 RepID=UPI00187E6642|nr:MULTISPECIES: Gldg family protein [unclassified Coleofasciculus]MBE9128441.1 Gldg family protein [Coleofasciculus sp. LEGE 07081]MBE9149402.1 Gldg family protein [Coleofasciculus sp. LEGE 07092]
MKTSRIKGKYLNYLFWLGPILTIMGISARVVSGEWSPVTLGLLIAGLIIIGLWVLLLESLAPGFWGRRSTQVGTNAVVATLSVFVILGLINFLGVRYAVQLDLTENKLFSLSPLSQEVVKNLEQSVKVWVFQRPASPADRELLANYRRYGSELEFEFVDPQLKPALAQKFNVQSPGEVYLEYGTERQLVQVLTPSEPLSEVELTNAIERITNDRAATVYFLQGHGERPLEGEDGLSLAVQALAEKNFTAQPLNLADRSEIPEDASLVVIAGPKRALFEPEVEAFRQYLSKGGSLLVMADPDTNPGLNSLLADWGVKLDNRIAIDASGQGRVVGLGPATPLVNKYGDHPITNDFGDGFSLYPLARPLETKPIEGIKETPLVITNDQSWAESSPENQPLEFNEEEGDIPGPLMLGVALSGTPESTTASSQAKGEDTESSQTASQDEKNAEAKEADASRSPEAEATASPEVFPQENAEASPSPEEEDTDKKETSPKKTADEARLVVFGNSNFATDGWFEQQLNSDVFLNSVTWLSKGNEQALSIRPKEQQNRRINLTPGQAGLLAWTAIGIVPIVGFLTAGVIWWLRR